MTSTPAQTIARLTAYSKVVDESLNKSGDVHCTADNLRKEEEQSNASTKLRSKRTTDHDWRSEVKAKIPLF